MSVVIVSMVLIVAVVIVLGLSWRIYLRRFSGQEIGPTKNRSTKWFRRFSGQENDLDDFPVRKTVMFDLTKAEADVLVAAIAQGKRVIIDPSALDDITLRNKEGDVISKYNHDTGWEHDSGGIRFDDGTSIFKENE